MSDKDKSTAVAKYDPRRAIGNPQMLGTLLEQSKDRLEALLPAHMPADRLVKTILVAVNRTPALLNCTGLSILESAMRSAELGLDLSGTLGEAYLIPFGDQATFIPGYQGLAKLVRQSGEVKRIEAEVVHENDKFIRRKGLNYELTFEPALTNRGKPIGAYAFVEFKDGGCQDAWMPVDEIEKIRHMGRQPNSLMWEKRWGEGAKKTVFRNLAKWLPKSPRLARALELADKEYEGAFEIDVTPPPVEAPPVVQQPTETQGDAAARKLRQAQTAAEAPTIDAATEAALTTPEPGKPAQGPATAAEAAKFPVEVIAKLPIEHFQIEALIELGVPGVKRGKKEDMVEQIRQWCTDQAPAAQEDDGLDEIFKEQPEEEDDDETPFPPPVNEGDPTPEQQASIVSDEMRTYLVQGLARCETGAVLEELRQEIEKLRGAGKLNEQDHATVVAAYKVRYSKLQKAGML